VPHLPAEWMFLEPDGTATATNFVGNRMEIEFNLDFVGPRSVVPDTVPLLS